MATTIVGVYFLFLHVEYVEKQRNLNDLEFPKEKMKGKNQLDIALIPNLFNKMRNNQHDFEQSGGTHAAPRSPFKEK